MAIIYGYVKRYNVRYCLCNGGWLKMWNRASFGGSGCLGVCNEAGSFFYMWIDLENDPPGHKKKSVR